MCLLCRPCVHMRFVPLNTYILFYDAKTLCRQLPSDTQLSVHYSLKRNGRASSMPGISNFGKETYLTIGSTILRNNCAGIIQDLGLLWLVLSGLATFWNFSPV